MSTERSPVAGVCPRCEATIPDHKVLIEYRTSDDGRSAFAECPECQEVVHPG